MTACRSWIRRLASAKKAALIASMYAEKRALPVPTVTPTEPEGAMTLRPRPAASDAAAKAAERRAAGVSGVSSIAQLDLQQLDLIALETQEASSDPDDEVRVCVGRVWV